MRLWTLLFLHRWELGASLVVSGALALASAWLANGIAADVVACQSAAESVRCSELSTRGTLDSQTVTTVLGLVGFLPFVVGPLVGAPLVAREIENGTASLAWPLAVSRLRWLGGDAGPTVLVAMLGVSGAAIAGWALVAAYAPGMDPARTFAHFGQYGPLLVIRFVGVVLVSVLVGVLVGRVLPALLVSFALAAIAFYALGAAYPHWIPAVPLPPAERPADSLGRQFVRQMVRLPSGELVSLDKALVLDPELNEIVESVEFGLPPDLASAVAMREGAAIVVVSGMILISIAVAIARRRPY